MKGNVVKATDSSSKAAPLDAAAFIAAGMDAGADVGGDTPFYAGHDPSFPKTSRGIEVGVLLHCHGMQ